jgi:biopolymer transport protein ExbD
LLAVVTFGAFLPAEAAAMRDTSEAASRSSQPDVVFVDLPVADEDYSTSRNCPLSIPQPPGELVDEPIEEYKTHRVAVDEDGNTLFNGMKIVTEDVDKTFKAYLVADGLTELQIQPYAQAKAGPVVKMLGAVANVKFPCSGFVGNERYRGISRAKSTTPELWPAATQNRSQLPNPTPQFDPVVVNVTATDSAGREPNDPNFDGAAKTGRCRAYFGDKPVSGSELVYMGQAVVLDAVERAGGLEKFHTGEANPSDIPPGFIAASQNTPWRCVGGVIYNLQMSGFLSLGFTLLPEG